MPLFSRALLALAPALLVLPATAQAQYSCFIEASAADAPQYTQPDNPWLYENASIPVDAQWLFGELPNGVRYAVRQNDVPPCQMSLRVRIDAGSLYEKDSEQGFAHLLEHMLFRESATFGPGEAIPHFQRLGASLGFDTNATTSPTATSYNLNLPNANRETLDDSVRRFAGMVIAPVLSAENLAQDLPIVLAEMREQAGPGRRIADATADVFFAGQLYADRSPIGTIATLQGATAESVQAFHRRWYRPENATVVLVGDADPRVLAAVVERHFADWRGEGALTPAPDFGAPQAPAGADPANPVGEVAVVVEPGLPRAMTFAIIRPWEPVFDSPEYNQGNMLGAIGLQIINRRLENAARAGGSYLTAGAARQKVSRSIDATFVSVTPLTDDWQTALTDVRAVIADALSQPPSQAEIDQVASAIDVSFVDMVEQSDIQSGAELADLILTAVDIREAVTAPENILDMFRGLGPRLTPDGVLAATQELFEGDVIRAVALSPNPRDVGEADLRSALLAPVMASGDARDDGEAIVFADLPPIGTPAEPVSVRPLGVLGVQGIQFPNGVRALIMDRDNEPGRVTVRVRFGSGWQGFAPDEAIYAELAPAALVNSGIGPLDQNDIDRLAADLKVGFDFTIEDGTFAFQGQTRQEDLDEQLYLFAAKLAMPSWDPAPVERARNAARLAYDSYGRDPGGVLNRDLDWLLRDRDPVYATPMPAELERATPEGFRAVWSRLLAEGPVEVAVFGDIDPEATIAALGRTFGALPPRATQKDVQASPLRFPATGGVPTTLTHAGDANQAAALIAWPTGGGSDGIVQSRKLDLLAQIFNNRLIDGLRERAGASYSPFATSNWPLDVDSGGVIFALVQIEPALAPVFFAEAQAIGADLAANGPTEDELNRAVEPQRQFLARATTGHTFWLGQLAGAAFDPNRFAYLPSIYADYEDATVAEMQALAQRYLAQPGWQLQVLPEGGAAARDIPAGR